MPGCFLHVFQLRPGFERGRDEGRTHRMGGVAASKTDLHRILPHHTVNRVRIHAPAGIEGLPVAANRTKQRPVHVSAMPCNFQIRTDSLPRLSRASQSLASTTLADHPPRIAAWFLLT